MTYKQNKKLAEEVQTRTQHGNDQTNFGEEETAKSLQNLLFTTRL